jgi:diguanylate cyclase (GGDEF)-like protein
VHRADRGCSPPCIALIDIDHFKRINDNHGHAQGDEVLRAFAACASAALRDTDTLGRWGGEEFIVMLPATSIEAAAGVMARVHAQLASVGLDAVHPGLRVTFSAGIAQRGAGEPLAATIERADQAMYAAKQGGRNRSVVAEAFKPVAPAATPPGTPHAPVASRRVAVPSSTP